MIVFCYENDQCRAVAAAVMGVDSYKVELIQHSFAKRPEAITSGEVDLLLNTYSRTMDREVYIPTVEQGITFSVPYSYITTAIVGERKYVACAEDGLRHVLECSGLKVCAQNSTRQADKLRLQLPRHQVVVKKSLDECHEAFIKGECNAVVAIAWVEMDKNYTGDFAVGTSAFTLEPLALGTRSDSATWSDFVNWVLQARFAAERYGITQENIHSIWHGNATMTNELPTFVHTNAFGEAFQDMFYHAIAAVGNWGEIDHRRVDPSVFPRQTINHAINRTNAGVMYSLPFGSIHIEGPGPSPDGRLAIVMKRGRLRCGIQVANHLGFVERTMVDNTTYSFFYQGMDVDYCRAVAASILGAEGVVEFVELANDEEGFDLLRTWDIDIFAGVAVNFERDSREPSTGLGFSFTQPYFYNNTAVDSMLRSK